MGQAPVQYVPLEDQPRDQALAIRNKIAESQPLRIRYHAEKKRLKKLVLDAIYRSESVQNGIVFDDLYLTVNLQFLNMDPSRLESCVFRMIVDHFGQLDYWTVHSVSSVKYNSSTYELTIDHVFNWRKMYAKSRIAPFKPPLNHAANSN
jgi:hypothetical protein